MGDTTERTLRLLGLLQQRPVWSGPELAARLGVTTRSIRRDVERLRALGYPVHAAQGVGGGYQLGRGRELPPLLLDDAEAVAIAVSLRLAAGGTVSGASEAALSTLAKLDQVMPPRLRSEVKAIHEATVTLTSAKDVVDGDVLLTLARACRDLVRVRFGYDARDGAATERRVEPVRLVATGRRWYLMAWDVDREDWRTFRLDRMREVVPSTWRFTAREHPDPAEYVRRSVSHSPFSHHARVRVHASLAEVAERTDARWATLTVIDEETTLLESSADALEWLAFHIAWLGFECEILDPPELRAAATGLADRLQRSAASG
ncbi:helix-turn-helix transcriptional regulator [Nocardioides sp. Soil805]|uniref:helix-turn-helix transcriptional regulator n=1 Tax=Nocardioides sp. Soil805 TaxID=1736416 RepID=UPI0007038FAE|nr:YafY family protein [Nocardioides sp. Soil805]KRF30696.1 transcriptional regulator [Nocardioides sp. Soil805]